jgi:dephospho-CoA kinase
MSSLVRKGFGEDILARVMAKDVEQSSANVIVLDGIRREEDMVELKENPNFVFIYIDADEHVRYERIVKRGENADDSSKTFEQFQKEQREIETEQTIPPLLRLAQHVIDNSGSEQELFDQLDTIIEKYGA